MPLVRGVSHPARCPGSVSGEVYAGGGRGLLHTRTSVTASHGTDPSAACSPPTQTADKLIQISGIKEHGEKHLFGLEAKSVKQNKTKQKTHQQAKRPQPARAALRTPSAESEADAAGQRPRAHRLSPLLSPVSLTARAVTRDCDKTTAGFEQLPGPRRPSRLHLLQPPVSPMGRPG